jgi:hypothetical protein
MVVSDSIAAKDGANVGKRIIIVKSIPTVLFRSETIRMGKFKPALTAFPSCFEGLSVPKSSHHNTEGERVRIWSKSGQSPSSHGLLIVNREILRFLTDHLRATIVSRARTGISLSCNLNRFLSLSLVLILGFPEFIPGVRKILPSRKGCA